MKFEEGYTVGIDLGTSYSALAQLDEYGDPIIVDNSDGDPITPSVILLKDGGRVVVGPDAEQIALADPDRVVIGVKRRMGDQNYSIPFEGRSLSPEFLSSMILRRLKQDGEKYVSPIRNAVITVPYYFNEPRRQATRHAGRIAGLNVVDIINEPTAATLAYAWRQGKLGRPDPAAKPQTVLVYDLGGGTFDVTVVQFTPTEFQVIATDGDTMLGGLDWSQRLVDYLAEQCETQIGLDPRKDPATHKLLGLQAEALKRDLTTADRSSLEVEFRGRTVAVEVTRREFESRTADLLHRTRDTTEFVLDQAGITASHLDEVILVGGSTTMPAVGKMLRELTGREPFRGLNPQAAVAQGAAIHAAILQVNHGDGRGIEAEALKRRLRSITLNDVNSHSLGVEITLPGGKKQNHIMIPRNSRLPVQVRQKFLTTHNNPAAIHVRLLEGEVSDISACTFIGDFRLIGLPGGLPKGSPVQITYGYSDRGHIVASLKDLAGGSEAQLEIAWNHAQDDQTLKTLELLAQSYNVQ